MNARCRIASAPFKSRGDTRDYAPTIELDGYDCGSNLNLMVRSFWVYMDTELDEWTVPIDSMVLWINLQRGKDGLDKNGKKCRQTCEVDSENIWGSIGCGSVYDVTVVTCLMWTGLLSLNRNAGP